MSRFHRIPLALLIAVALSSASEPLRQTLLALERADIEAFKSKDTNFPTSYLADTFIGYGASGKIDKATASKQYASHNCTLQSHFIASEQLTQLDTDVALLTYKKSLNGTCGAEALPAESSSANVFVRKARKWQSIFYAESAIVAPAVIAPQPQQNTKTLDPETQLLLSAEKAIWQAWGNQDRSRLQALTTQNMSFINIFGTRFLTKADALQDWTSHGCQVKSTAVNHPQATFLSPKVAILTFHGSADGTCFGQKIGPIWGTSTYIKQGSKWKWPFGINIPAKS